MLAANHQLELPLFPSRLGSQRLEMQDHGYAVAGRSIAAEGAGHNSAEDAGRSIAAEDDEAANQPINSHPGGHIHKSACTNSGVRPE